MHHPTAFWSTKVDDVLRVEGSGEIEASASFEAPWGLCGDILVKKHDVDAQSSSPDNVLDTIQQEAQ